MPDDPWVLITHPSVAGQVYVRASAFTSVWQGLGWVLVGGALPVVPLAGYVLKSDAIVGALGARKVTREFADPNRPAAKWQEVYGTALFAGVADPVKFGGWNAERALNAGVPNEASVYEGMEARYRVNGADTVEWYIGVIPDAGANGDVLRPFAFTANASGAARWAQSHIDIGPDAGGGFNILAGPGNSILGAGPNGLTTKPITVDGTGGSLQVTSGSVIVNTTATDGGHILMRRNGVETWYLGNFNGDISTYLWDAVNGRPHVQYIPGNSNGNALTRVQSSLQVYGNVGFFGGPAIEKRAATADATDLASAIALVNTLKAHFVDYGLKAAA